MSRTGSPSPAGLMTAFAVRWPARASAAAACPRAWGASSMASRAPSPRRTFPPPDEPAAESRDRGSTAPHQAIAGRSRWCAIRRPTGVPYGVWASTIPRPPTPRHGHPSAAEGPRPKDRCPHHSSSTFSNATGLVQSMAEPRSLCSKSRVFHQPGRPSPGHCRCASAVHRDQAAPALLSRHDAPARPVVRSAAEGCRRGSLGTSSVGAGGGRDRAPGRPSTSR